MPIKKIVALWERCYAWERNKQYTKVML